MTKHSLLFTLILAGAAGTAQAATWNLETSTIQGLRVGAVSFDGLPAGVHLGNVTDDLNSVGLDWHAAGSWRSLTASLGGNAIDYHLQHEADVQAVSAGDPSTASLTLAAVAGLDNPSITLPTVLSAVALAPVQVDATFLLQPEAGETDGMPVYVTFWGGYKHQSAGEGHSPFLSTGYSLYHNDVLLDGGLFTGLGEQEVARTFHAAIGDRFRLVVAHTAQASVAGLPLTPGVEGAVWSIGEAGARLTVSPIPEPETWAMLLAGLGLVGLQLRRKPRIVKKLEI
jgi:hypothetical protein